MIDTPHQTLRHSEVLAKLGLHRRAVVAASRGDAEERFIEINAPDGLYMLAIGEGDDFRFAKQFSATWTRIARIAVGDRDAIRRVWDAYKDDKNWNLEIERQGWSPRICLQQYWLQQAFKPCNEAANVGGHVLYFKASVVEQHLDADDGEYVATLIAHELAHSLDKAHGNWGKKSANHDLPHDVRRKIVEKYVRASGSALEARLRALGKHDIDDALDWIDEEERINGILRGWGFDPMLVS